MNKLIVTLFLCLSGLVVKAQVVKGIVQGYVFSNGAPAPYANISLKNTSYGTTCNEKGYFIIKNIPTASYQLLVSHIGYESFQQTVLVKENDTITLSITLNTSNVKMEEVVVTGQYEPTEVKRSVYKVKVVGAKDIQQRGAVNLRDVLTQELNARIIHDNVLGSNIILQGLSGQNVKILLDGIPLISGAANEFDLNQINLNNIERIEIIEGPLSVQYGTNALAGTVNLISKELPKGKKAAIGLNTYYESVGQYNADVSVGTAIKKNKLIGSFGRNQFTGFSSLEEERTMNWNPKTQYFGNLRYARKIKKVNLGLTYNQFNEKSIGLGIPTTTSSYSIATDRYRYVTRWNSNFYLNGKVGKKGYIDFVGGYQQYDQESIKYLVNLKDDTKKKTTDPADHDITRFDTWTYRGAYSRKGLAKDKITLQLGYDLNWNSSAGGRVNTASSTLFDGGVFCSVNYKPIKQLEIQPAFRYVISNQFSTDKINFLSMGLPIIPSLNLKYVWKEKTQIRASYAKGFRAPSLRELYFYFHDANHSIDGNPDLTPESANNFIVAIRHAIVKDNWSLRIEPSVYFNDMKDRIYLISKETTAPGDENKVNKTYLNLPFFRTQGGNLNLTYSQNRLAVRAGAGLIARSGSKSIGDKFYSYEASSSVSYHLPNWDTKIKAFYKYNGPLAEFSIVNDEVVDRTIQDYNMLDLSISKAFKKDFILLTFGAKNLFDVTNVDQTGDGSDGVLPRTGFKQSVPISWGRTFFLNLKLNLTK